MSIPKVTLSSQQSARVAGGEALPERVSARPAVKVSEGPTCLGAVIVENFAEASPDFRTDSLRLLLVALEPESAASEIFEALREYPEAKGAIHGIVRDFAGSVFGAAHTLNELVSTAKALKTAFASNDELGEILWAEAVEKGFSRWFSVDGSKPFVVSGAESGDCDLLAENLSLTDRGLSVFALEIRNTADCVFDFGLKACDISIVNCSNIKIDKMFSEGEGTLYSVRVTDSYNVSLTGDVHIGEVYVGSSLNVNIYGSRDNVCEDEFSKIAIHNSKTVEVGIDRAVVVGHVKFEKSEDIWVGGGGCPIVEAHGSKDIQLAFADVEIDRSYFFNSNRVMLGDSDLSEEDSSEEDAGEA